MQAPRLVATDVDGTLLGPDDRVTPRAAAVIERVVAAGVGFVLVTGRPPRWIPPVVDQLGVAPVAVCANGGVLYDAASDEILWSRTLEPEVLAEIATAAAEVLPTCRLAVERLGPLDGARSPSEGGHFVVERDYRDPWASTDPRIASRDEVLAAPAVKLLIRCPELSSDAMVAALAPVVGDTADLTYSHPRGLVEVSPAGVTKASGLAEIARRLDVPPEEVVAFGDMPNDLPMLEWAGHGVAMGNAHPAVLEAADEVTAPNTEDGLALVLERWF